MDQSFQVSSLLFMYPLPSTDRIHFKSFMYLPEIYLDRRWFGTLSRTLLLGTKGFKFKLFSSSSVELHGSH